MKYFERVAFIFFWGMLPLWLLRCNLSSWQNLIFRFQKLSLIQDQGCSSSEDVFSVQKRDTLHLDDVLQSNPESKSRVKGVAHGEVHEFGLCWFSWCQPQWFCPSGNAPATIYSSTVVKLQKDITQKGISHNICKTNVFPQEINNPNPFKPSCSS